MTERQVQLIADFKPDIIMVTPSYMLAIADEMQKQGLIHAHLLCGWVSSVPSRGPTSCASDRGAQLEAIDLYGLSEVIGPGVAQECIETKDGLTIWEDHFYPEIIDPQTGRVLPDGEKGELVITSLTKEALPVIRYRTRDLTRLLPGTARAPCDTWKNYRALRHAHRPRRERLPVADRGAHHAHPGLAPHYVLELTKHGPLDHLTVIVEGDAGAARRSSTTSSPPSASAPWKSAPSSAPSAKPSA